MQVREFVSQMFLLDDEGFKAEGRTADGFKFYIDGINYGLNDTMPVCKNALLRFGRHIYMINTEDYGHSMRILTMEGT